MAPAPRVGATTGTTMKVAITIDIVRAMRSPSKTSRTMATASERGAAAPRPQKTRQMTMAARLGMKDATMPLTT